MNYEIRKDEITGLYYIELGVELVAHSLESMSDARRWLRDVAGVRR